MRKQPPFHRPADGWETLQSAQLSSPHASPLAFPALGYSGPLCHCGGFHSATTQIMPEREKHEKLKLQARRGGDALFTVCLVCFFIIYCHQMVSELIYWSWFMRLPKPRHPAAVYNKFAIASPALVFKELIWLSIARVLFLQLSLSVMITYTHQNKCWNMRRGWHFYNKVHWGIQHEQSDDQTGCNQINCLARFRAAKINRLGVSY